jgi:DNA polymerase III delta subunit
MLKVEELEKQVNSGVAEGIYLFYGAETFLLEQQVKKMKKSVDIPVKL